MVLPWGVGLPHCQPDWLTCTAARAWAEPQTSAPAASSGRAKPFPITEILLNERGRWSLLSETGLAASCCEVSKSRFLRGVRVRRANRRRRHERGGDHEQEGERLRGDPEHVARHRIA